MIGILIIARMGSTRLPGKHLQMINNKYAIEWLIMRINSQLKDISNKKVIIATSTEPDNKQFEILKPMYNVEIFYGSNGNIPNRILDCATMYALDKIVCIGGDNPLTTMIGCKDVIEKLDVNDYVETYNLPIGMNVFGFTYKSLVYNLTDEYKNKVDLEFGWNLIFKNIYRIKYNEKIYDNVRVTMDYYDDYIFFKTVIEFVGDSIVNITDAELIQVILDNNFHTINNHLLTEYWVRFNRGLDSTFNK